MEELTATELKQYWPIIEGAVLDDGPRMFRATEAAATTPREHRLVLIMATLGAAAVLHAAELRQLIEVRERGEPLPQREVRRRTLAALRAQLDIHEEREIVDRLTDDLEWPDATEPPG